MKFITIFCIMASCAMADTNKVDRVDKPDKAEKPVKPEKIEKEKKLQHDEKKITIKERDKGSKKESDWKPVKEYTLMFKNNRKARPKK
jgi:hypothetical protein